jgi:AraC family ethanolamine operon transcriptional activator
MEGYTALPLAPTKVRFTDADEFRSSIGKFDMAFTPLALKISAEQTILKLPGCDVNYMKSFPRIIDAQLQRDCTAIAFNMDDGTPVRFNGIEESMPAIVVGTGGAVYTQVERGARSYTSIIFNPSIEHRGWFASGPSWCRYVVSRTMLERLRSLVLHLFSAASGFGDDPESVVLGGSMRESVLAAIDLAFADIVTAPELLRQNFSPKFKIFRNAEAAIAEHYDAPIYSGDVARQIGVSVRTLHDAILQYRGMSLHRWLRLRRLWLVRQRLLAGTPSVKAAALAFGFWHLGDFAHNYQRQFGESPSVTLARARSH